MKTLVVFFALLIVGSLPAQTRRNYTVDLENRNPAVGSLLIVVTETNPFGFRLGVGAFCSGVLIADRVFLTAGHCVGRDTVRPTTGPPGCPTTWSSVGRHAGD